MFIKPDFSEVLEKAKLQDGEYPVRIVAAEMKKDKNGADYIMWKLAVFGCEGDLAKFNNWTINYMSPISGMHAYKLQNLAKAVGVEMNEGFDTDMLMGKELKVSVVVPMKEDGTSGFAEIKNLRNI